jgi:hypothetical protein
MATWSGAGGTNLGDKYYFMSVRQYTGAGHTRWCAGPPRSRADDQEAVLIIA